jgi:hypothetical protein
MVDSINFKKLSFYNRSANRKKYADEYYIMLTEDISKSGENPGFFGKY